MPQPLVSVVTPSYNQGRFIRAAIESVLSQDYPGIEYTIMDGGSTDETASIVRDYSSRVRWVSEPDRGQSHAINKGFQMAKGSIVSWLNSDDWILPGAVGHAVAGFAAQPEAGAVYGEGYLADREGRIKGPFACTEPMNLWKLVHVSDYILQQTVYFRRAALEKVGYLREDLQYVMDWDILIRMGKQYSLHYIPEFMGCLREYPESKSFSGGTGRLREIREMLREHTGLRFPPGYLVYGLHTYREVWRDFIHSRTNQSRKPSRPRPFANRLDGLLSGLCGYWADRTERGSQGWYPDRWAGPVVKYMLPAGPDRTVVLTGSISRRQKLTILAGGIVVAEKMFEPGDMEWSVNIPASLAPMDLLIKASWWFLERRREGLRRVSYVLRSVRSDACIDSKEPGQLRSLSVLR